MTKLACRNLKFEYGFLISMHRIKLIPGIKLRENHMWCRTHGDWPISHYSLNFLPNNWKTMGLQWINLQQLLFFSPFGMLNLVWYGRLSYKFWFLIVFMLILEVHTDWQRRHRKIWRVQVGDYRQEIKACLLWKIFAGFVFTEYDSVTVAEQLDWEIMWRLGDWLRVIEERIEFPVFFPFFFLWLVWSGGALKRWMGK